MPKRPTTVDEYIEGAPDVAQPHLRKLRALLQTVAPDAQELMKWGTPFYVEPRFLFAFSAHKAHLDFSPMASGLAPFAAELAKHRTTKNFLQVRYDEPLPEKLIERIAKRRVRELKKRKSDGFW